MDTIGAVIYCQGFIFPGPYLYTVREMGLCDLSGRHQCVYTYENSGPCYENLSTESKAQVDLAIEQHGVEYHPKYPTGQSSSVNVDFDHFIDKYSAKSAIGVWSGDEVGKAFLTGLGCPFVEIPHNDLQRLPLGCVLEEEKRYRNPNCSGHHLRRVLDDDDSQMHRCSLEYACALSALVRKETHYRSPTLVEDLLYQKNLWQYRCLRLLDQMLCSFDCQAEAGEAFEKGQGLEWYTDCDTGPCWWIKRIFPDGVFQPIRDWDPEMFPDHTLDTLTVLTPPKEKQ